MRITSADLLVMISGLVVASSVSCGVARQPLPARDQQPIAGAEPEGEPPGEPLGLAICRTIKSDDNLILSPVSVVAALEFALAGAKGKTAEEIRSRLLPEDRGKVRILFGKDQPQDKGEVQLTTASAIWLDEGYIFSRLFRDALGEFDTSFDNLPFGQNPLAAVGVINSWVRDKTHGEIKELYPEGKGLEPTVRLIITNAIAFKAAWSHPFLPRATREEEFTVQAGQGAVKTPMMHQTHEFRYAEDDGTKYLEMPYADPRYVMLLVLPKTGGSLSDAERRLFAVCQGPPAPVELRQASVNVAVPKFTARGRLNLRPSLEALGLKTPFIQGLADFSGMVSEDARELYISEILQEAFVEVNERGSRAAAATGLSVGITSAESVNRVEEFKADRPFVFAIVDTKEHAALFVGRIVDPRH